jgi:predicted nucleic acid-binding protein
VIVVDTNVVCYVLLAREKTESARAVFEKDSDWVLPPLWEHEFLNVLANYVRHGQADPSLMKTAWYRGLEFFRSVERQPSMDSALELAAKYDISAYDAQFVALARSLEVPLVSEDRRLRRRCPETVVSMTDYLKS